MVTKRQLHLAIDEVKVFCPSDIRQIRVIFELNKLQQSSLLCSICNDVLSLKRHKIIQLKKYNR